MDPRASVNYRRAPGAIDPTQPAESGHYSPAGRENDEGVCCYRSVTSECSRRCKRAMRANVAIEAKSPGGRPAAAALPQEGQDDGFKPRDDRRSNVE